MALWMIDESTLRASGPRSDEFASATAAEGARISRYISVT